MADIAGDRISYKIDIAGLENLSGMKSTIQRIEKLMPGLTGAVKDAKTSMKQMDDVAANSKVTDSLSRQKRGFDDVSSSARRTGEEFSRTRSKAQQYDSTLRRATGKPYFKQQTRDLNALGGKLQSFGAKATAMTAGIAAGAAVAIKAATNLQNRYKVITNLAVTGGEKQTEATRNVAAMQKDGAKLSSRYAVSQKKIGEGYETLIRRGYTTNQALGSQKSYLQGAIASGDSYSDVVNNAASAIEQFGMKVNSVKGMALASKTAINQMAYSADLTATSFGQLGESLKFSGPDAKAAHQTLHNTVAVAGDLSNFGIEGSQAGTSMRQIYQRLTSPPTKGKAPGAMKKLGLSYDDFRDSKHELLPIQDIFGKLATKMNKMKLSTTDKGAIYAALFGVNASSAAQALGNSYKQVDALDKRVQKAQNMNHGKGYVSELSKKNMDSLQFQWKDLKTNLLNSGIDVANVWMPTLTKMAKAANKVLKTFSALPEPTKKFISIGVGLTAVVGPLALLAGSLVKIHAGLNSLSKLGGKGGSESSSLLSTVGDFFGIGAGKNNVKGFKDRVGTTHFSSEAKLPGSFMLNSGRANRSTLKEAGSLAGEGRNIFRSTYVGHGLGVATDWTKDLAGKGASAVVGKGKSIMTGGLDLARTFGSSAKGRVIGMAKSVPEFLSKSGLGRVVNHTGGTLAKTTGLGLKTAKFAASKIPVLDLAAAGLNMMGTNKNNAGKKVGSTAGMLAGGAVGSLMGPIGSMAGAAIGQTLGTKLGKTLDKTMPKSVKNSLGKVLKSIGSTFDRLMKPFRSTAKSIGRVWSQSTKGISKSWNQYVVRPLSGKNGGKLLVSVFKTLRAVMIPVLKVGGVAFKVFGAVVKTAIKAAAHIIEGLIKTISGVFSLVSDLIHGRWKNIWKDAVQIFSGIFGTIKNVLGDILGAVWDGIKDLGKNIGKFLAHPVKTMESWVGAGNSSLNASDVTNGARANQKQLKRLSSGKKPQTSKPKINVQTGIGHAAGGAITMSHLAMVGEKGRELAYNARLGRYRVLGGQGPALAKVFAGEHILNARDTHKVMSGGLGQGLTLPGYASGTTKLGQSKNKMGSASLNFDAYGASTKKSTKSLSKLQKSSKREWSTLQRDAGKSTSRLSKLTSKDFNSIQKKTGKTTDILRKSTVKDFDSMQKGSMVQMDQMHKGMNSVAKAMIDDFGKIFGKLDNKAHKAMADAIKQLNAGIRGIDTVLNKFGGGGSVLPLIHYAQGSKGPISKHTMAVVNDAKVGPRQETIVKANGRAYMPKGNDVTLPLAPGDEVLNGTETAKLQDVGALPHFAKGTGGLRRLINRSSKDPRSAWNRDFGSNTNSKMDTALGDGVFGVGKRAATHVGVPWNAEAWSQLKDAMSGGTGGGPVLHSPGAGWTKSSGFGNRGSVGGGFGSHDGNDFRGAKTVHAMQDAIVTGTGGAPSGWGGSKGIGQHVDTKGGRLSIIYQELNGKANSGADILVHKGEHVKQGQPIAKLGPNGTHVHVGASTHGLWSHGGESTRGWLDITKLHSSFGNTTKQKKSKNPALTKLVKSELGSRLKWVSNHLGEDSIGSLGSLSLSGGLASRARTLAAALKKMYPAATNAGIAAVLGNWNFESGGLNPGAVNPGGGASGLGQWLGGRKTGLINFARRHHENWKSAGAQLEYALKGDGSDSSVLKSVLRGTGSVASLAAKFSNLWERGGYTAQHVAGARKIQAALHANGGWAKNGAVNVFGEAKGENEVAVNTQRPSADPLLLEAMSDRANKAPNSVFGQLKAFAKMQHEFAKMKESQTTFSRQAKASNPVKSQDMAIRPQFTYSPHITITGAGDPKETAKVLSKQEAKERRKFESMMSDFIERARVAE